MSRVSNVFVLIGRNALAVALFLLIDRLAIFIASQITNDPARADLALVASSLVAALVAVWLGAVVTAHLALISLAYAVAVSAIHVTVGIHALQGRSALTAVLVAATVASVAAWLLGLRRDAAKLTA
jgi:hypothetical protein